MVLTTSVIALCCLIGSQFIHRLGIKAAYRWKLLDIPSPRRRHRKPTPITGGLGIMLCWSLGIAAVCFFEPGWFSTYVHSLIPIGISLSILLVLGIFDDVRGLTPKPKFIFQILAAAIVIAFEPNLHFLCLAWKSVIGDFVWPVMAIWIVGITNAINLIDGLDGLAGGTAFLVSSAVAILSFLSMGDGGVQGVSMILLSVSILGFLKFNWSPAKIFLGDNGSLPLGFLIAISSLTCRPPTRSWVMVASIVLMLGYPILDMGLAVLRRYRNGLALFKADRNHLHFRVQRLGLSTAQTATFLLSISLYLQVSALCLQLLPVNAVPPAIVLVLFSIFGLLYVVRCIEQSRVSRISAATQSGQLLRRKADEKNLHLITGNTTVIQIQLGPVFEVGLFEEKARYKELVNSLEMLLKATASKNEMISMQGSEIQILLHGSDHEKISTKEIRKKYEEKLEKFCSMVDFQCSMSTIPVKIKKAQSA